ncbi:hypothetical protein CINS5915_07060 [Campylobacter insulaenigrae]|uniref:hypothetical protein n=1 Tax=Campylobacter insulaenigrae TaxID=260714 RepID=UPI0021523836|nr:hypothetical protein [Campylobacter insulaenigrae]MCR6571425.1 hypothetical protein [Campylobacter insulaenigrae]MCR6573083.1 hypothetical protein [Campylobacter insulaenigrae]MCR6574536.1 hypothetical protein [Campylobacter insulaenigrae]MCR6576121.1 hypothetical protein [Campylobacter insulaenigrae]MCR6577628.1 hypothetical protein [Campylobacter insulaenigrae]
MKFFLIFLCFVSGIFANSFENKKIIKLDTQDEFNIINLNQDIDYEKLSNITTLALIPSYEKEYNFYFSNFKIDSYTMAKNTLLKLNYIVNQNKDFILISQKENQNYINSQSFIHPQKEFVNANNFLEFNNFKKPNFIVLLDLKNIQATQRNFLFFSSFDTLIDIEYKIYNAKTNKLKDHRLLTIQSNFNTNNKEKSYEELVTNISNAIYEDIRQII